jgi:hypothetical protein
MRAPVLLASGLLAAGGLRLLFVPRPGGMESGARPDELTGLASIDPPALPATSTGFAVLLGRVTRAGAPRAALVEVRPLRDVSGCRTVAARPAADAIATGRDGSSAAVRARSGSVAQAPGRSPCGTS